VGFLKTRLWRGKKKPLGVRIGRIIKIQGQKRYLINEWESKTIC
jgi:hypothetical protein